jgi:hypothetical protein
MAVSTIFTNTEDQVWVAKQDYRRTWAGTMESLLDRLVNVEYSDQPTTWEETCQDSKGRAIKPCSKLLVLVREIYYDEAHVSQIWKDTGWRMWREQ